MTTYPQFRWPDASYTTVRLVEEVVTPLRRFSGIYRSTFLAENFPFCRQIDLYCVVERGKRALLIDTGHFDLCGHGALDAVSRLLGVPWERTDVLITHFHEDHDGNLSYCLDQGVANVYSGQLLSCTEETKKDFLRQAASLDLYDEQMSSFLNMVMGGKNVVEASRDIRLACSGGEVLPYADYQLEVIPTPGHTLDHISLLDRERGILFAGDFIIDAPPGLMQFAADQHLMVRHLENLARARTLNLSALFMSHRDPLFGSQSIGSFISMIQQRYDTLLEQTMEYVKRVRRTTVRQAAADRASRYPGGLDGFNPMMQGTRIANMFANLECLHDRGELVRLEGDDGEFVYKPRRSGALII